MGTPARSRRLGKAGVFDRFHDDVLTDSHHCVRWNIEIHNTTRPDDGISAYPARANDYCSAGDPHPTFDNYSSVLIYARNLTIPPHHAEVMCSGQQLHIVSEKSIVTDHDTAADGVYEHIGETGGLANLDTGHRAAHDRSPK